MIKDSFPVTGMSCASCALNVERTLRRQAGVVRADVNFANGGALVEFDPAVTDPEVLQQAVRGIGYDLVVPRVASEEPEVERRGMWRLWWAIGLTVPLVVMSMAAPQPYIEWGLATPVVLILGWPFFRHGAQMAFHGMAGMDTLIALSTGSAYLWSVYGVIWRHGQDIYFESAAVVITFLLLGKGLEERAKSSAAGAIRGLMGLRPATVLLEDGRELRLELVRPGDKILVRPGERIAVDGVVEMGESYVDESMLSGEPVPVPKKEGDTLWAGTLNQKGSFRMRAGKVGKDTLLEGIIARVREAQGSKAPVQQVVDKVAAVFVPSILGIAVLSLVLWWGHSASRGFDAFVSVLVIACPCALGLATPMALMVGIGRGAKAGIFVKDAASLERLRKVTAVVLDKTGTLTEGKPRVEEIVWFGEKQPLAEALLFSLERMSEHPLGEAIAMNFADLPILPIEEVRSVTGSGVEGRFAKSRLRVGNSRWLGLPLPPEAGALERGARTVVYFARDDRVLAGIALSDRLKEGALEVVAELERRGLRVYMLTGDNEAAAAAVGIAKYRAGLLPADKAAFIRDLQKGGAVVAMAGDGINDAEALAVADVGIAMGKGTDVAMDVAGMTLVNGALDRIPKALDLSQDTFRTVKQNLVFAFLYNILAIPLAAAAVLNPMIAGAAMAGSSLTVVLNSLRLRRNRRTFGAYATVH